MSDFATLSMVPIEICKELFKTQENPVFAELQWFNFSPFCSDVHVYSLDNTFSCGYRYNYYSR